MHSQIYSHKIKYHFVASLHNSVNQKQLRTVVRNCEPFSVFIKCNKNINKKKTPLSRRNQSEPAVRSVQYLIERT